MTTMTINSRPLVELQAKIVELEEAIPDKATRDRVLDVPKKLLGEAQDHHRKGNLEEARLTLNTAHRLVEKAKREPEKLVLSGIVSLSA
jgi:hypothetical protein